MLGTMKMDTAELPIKSHALGVRPTPPPRVLDNILYGRVWRHMHFEAMILAVQDSADEEFIWCRIVEVEVGVACTSGAGGVGGGGGNLLNGMVLKRQCPEVS